jgi:hypothetical protein
MRRSGPILALAAAVLGGCAYDPYTGTYVPCCAYYGYPYGYYRYPAPYDPGVYPPGPPPGQPGAEYAPAPGPPPGPPGQPAGPPGAPAHGGGLAQRFAAANVTHDGRLTREQAAAGMPNVARQFDAIDTAHKGYVTLEEIRAFMAQRRPQGAPPG